MLLGASLAALAALLAWQLWFRTRVYLLDFVAQRPDDRCGFALGTHTQGLRYFLNPDMPVSQMCLSRVLPHQPCPCVHCAHMHVCSLTQLKVAQCSVVLSRGTLLA